MQGLELSAPPLLAEMGLPLLMSSHYLLLLLQDLSIDSLSQLSPLDRLEWKEEQKVRLLAKKAAHLQQQQQQ